MFKRTDLRSVVLAAALAAIASLPAVAAEGRIPIPFTSPPTGPCFQNFGNLGVGNSTGGDNFIPTGAARCN